MENIEKFLNNIAIAEEYKGKHFTSYLGEVIELKRSGNQEDLEFLLLRLIEATERGDQISHQGVALWYYEELAKLYRKQKEYKKEVEILNRFAWKRHAPGVKPNELLIRLKKAKLLLEKNCVK